MEHKVYLCSWNRSKAGFALWVKSRPIIRGEGLTYLEAEQHLIEAIQNAGGAMHAVLEFDRPLPKSTLERKYSSPALYLICGDDRFETNEPRRKPFESSSDLEQRLCRADAFYQEPICRVCRNVRSRRSDKPLALEYVPGDYDGAFGSIGYDWGPQHQIVSEDFLSLLSETELLSLEIRPVIAKGRRRFYELIGPEGPPPVAVAGMNPSGWRCDKCGYRTWGYWNEEIAVCSFVARSDLPKDAVGVFTVGLFPEIHLAVSAARWAEMVGGKGTRGFVSSPLGVVPSHEIVREPELPMYKR